MSGFCSLFHLHLQTHGHGGEMLLLEFQEGYLEAFLSKMDWELMTLPLLVLVRWLVEG